MIDKKEINALVEEFLKDSGNYLVDILIASGNLITVEIDNDNGVNIDDCVELSRYLESKFDRDTEDFELTVTSAGLTSPFKTLRQYKKKMLAKTWMPNKRDFASTRFMWQRNRLGRKNFRKYRYKEQLLTKKPYFTRLCIMLLFIRIS